MNRSSSQCQANQRWDDEWKEIGKDFREDASFWVNTDKVKYEFVHRILGRNQGVALEVGCGTATISSWLHNDTLIQTYILDQSQSALALASTRMKDPSRSLSIQGDAFSLPFRDDSFDFVHSYGLIEHFEDVRPVVGQMVRVLKPGGTLFIDYAPRKFSLDLLFDALIFLPAYIFLVGMVYSLTHKEAFRRDLVKRAGQWKYKVAYFFESQSERNQFATGEFEARIDPVGLEGFLREEMGLRSVRTTGSMLLPRNLYRILWKISPGLHRAIQRATENKGWTVPLSSGIWVSGRKQ